VNANPSNAALPPLSLYVHLPWCVAKCPYCDFNSHKAGDSPPRQQYIEAIKADLALEARHAHGRRVKTVFIGGGTPSLFSPAGIQEILHTVHTVFDVASDAEITMEANPGTVECGTLADYRSAGVNRLSLGAQSFDADSLRRLGRIHGPGEILDAYREATAAAFDSINIDLMYGLPGQTLAMALTDLRQALALQPQHLSYYHLTLEPNTVFYQRPPQDLPDADTAFEMQEACHGVLNAAGYTRYEVSAFARPGFACRHNLNYWQFGDYIAVGAGAHGKITDPQGAIRRYRKPAHPLSYMGAVADNARPVMTVPLSREDLRFEYMLNVLRLPQGFTTEAFEARTGIESAALHDCLETCRGKGLLRQCGDGSWQPTGLGLRFLNDLQEHFLPSDAPLRRGDGVPCEADGQGAVMHKE